MVAFGLALHSRRDGVTGGLNRLTLQPSATEPTTQKAMASAVETNANGMDSRKTGTGVSPPRIAIRRYSEVIGLRNNESRSATTNINTSTALTTAANPAKNETATALPPYWPSIDAKNGSMATNPRYSRTIRM
jgi:hypothetical protein